MKISAGLSIGGLAGCLLLGASFPVPAARAALLLEYRFNADASSQPSTGTLADAVTTQGTAKIGADAAGVSGLAGDRAFDNTAAVAMGANSTSNYKGVAANTTTSIGSLGALTIAGWFKADEIIGSGAYLLRTDQFNLRAYDTAAPGTNGVLQLSVAGSSAQRSAVTNSLFGTVGAWVFFAVTWNGSTVSYYQGSTGQETALLNSVSFSATMAGVTTTGLQVGNIPFSSIGASGTARIFDGMLDNLRVYDEALSLASLTALQAGDLANIPEPGGYALALAAASLAGCILWRGARLRRWWKASALVLCAAWFVSPPAGAKAVVDHVFSGTEDSASLVGGGARGEFNGTRHSFEALPKPNRYFLYYSGREDFRLSLTDSKAGGPDRQPCLLVNRLAGGDQKFGGLSLAVAIPEWTPGGVTTRDLDRLVLSVTLAATAGVKTPLFVEALDAKGGFLVRIAPDLKVQNDGGFHEHAVAFAAWPAAEKERLVRALNTAGSTTLGLNFIFNFGARPNSPAPFLALKRLSLENN